MEHSHDPLRYDHDRDCVVERYTYSLVGLNHRIAAEVSYFGEYKDKAKKASPPRCVLLLLSTCCEKPMEHIGYTACSSCGRRCLLSFDELFSANPSLPLNTLMSFPNVHKEGLKLGAEQWLNRISPYLELDGALECPYDFVVEQQLFLYEFEQHMNGIMARSKDRFGFPKRPVIARMRDFWDIGVFLFGKTPLR